MVMMMKVHQVCITYSIFVEHLYLLIFTTVLCGGHYHSFLQKKKAKSDFTEIKAQVLLGESNCGACIRLSLGLQNKKALFKEWDTC